MPVYLPAKFEVFSIILMSFRPGGDLEHKLQLCVRKIKSLAKLWTYLPNQICELGLIIEAFFGPSQGLHKTTVRQFDNFYLSNNSCLVLNI